MAPWRLDHTSLHGVLVLEGFIVRELVTAGRVSADLLGPEDVIDSSAMLAEVSVLEHTVTWTAMSRVRLALLDAELFARAADWPAIAAALVRRAARPGRRLVLANAIATLPSVDVRLLASMWSWASQWGTVSGNGVVLRIPLSHERLGRLIGARRPTVTGVVGRLRRAGWLERRSDHAWLLHAAAQSGQADPAGGFAIPALESMIAPPGLGVGPARPASSAQSGAEAVAEMRARIDARRAEMQASAQTRQRTMEQLRGEFAQLRSHRAEMSELRTRAAAQRTAGDPARAAGGVEDDETAR